MFFDVPVALPSRSRPAPQSYIVDTSRIFESFAHIETINIRGVAAHPTQPNIFINLAEKVAGLTSEIADLRKQLSALSEQLEAVMAATAATRDIPDEDAKKEIKEYFEEYHGETIYPSEISDTLHLDYDLVIRLIQELCDAGEIAAT
jgi:hypothetical protein